MIDKLKHMGIKNAFWWTVGLFLGGAALCCIGVLIAKHNPSVGEAAGYVLIVGLLVMLSAAFVSFFGMVCPNCGKKQLRYLPMQQCCEKCGMPFEKPEDKKAKRTRSGRRAKG